MNDIIYDGYPRSPLQFQNERRTIVLSIVRNFQNLHYTVRFWSPAVQNAEVTK